MRHFHAVILPVLTVVLMLSWIVHAAGQNLPDELEKLANPEQFENLQERIQQEIELVTQQQDGKKGSIDLAYWVTSFFFSLLGTAMFIYGKKQADYKFLAGGLVLMLYPYFIHSTFWIVIIGLGILALMAAAARFL